MLTTLRKVRSQRLVESLRSPPPPMPTVRFSRLSPGFPARQRASERVFPSTYVVLSESRSFVCCAPAAPPHPTLVLAAVRPAGQPAPAPLSRDPESCSLCWGRSAGPGPQGGAGRTDARPTTANETLPPRGGRRGAPSPSPARMPRRQVKGGVLCLLRDSATHAWGRVMKNFCR